MYPDPAGVGGDKDASVQRRGTEAVPLTPHVTWDNMFYLCFDISQTFSDSVASGVFFKVLNYSEIKLSSNQSLQLEKH